MDATALTADLPLVHLGQPIPAVWACARESLAELEATAPAWLHAADQECSRAYAFPRRRHSFLLGRRAAQRALVALLGLSPDEALEVRPGVLGYPVVASADHRRPQVSIAHTRGMSVAVAFFEDHLMAIDLEHVAPPRREAIRRYCRPAECALLDAQEGSPGLIETALWACRESLSKALRTGLPLLEAYELKSLDAVSADHWRATFRHFPQFRAEVFRRGDMVQALALPAETGWDHVPPPFLRALL